MHFREQGRSLQLIRTSYDASKGRGIQTVIGKLPQFSYVIPAEIEKLLTAEEMRQLADYLAALEAGRKDQGLSFKLRGVAEDIAAAAAAVLAGHAPKDADAIWAAMAEMGKALKKAGHPRPVKAKPAVSAQ